MKKVILFIALFACFSTIAFSQCTVNSFIEDNYTLYAKFLALREIQANPADPDHNNPIIPAARLAPFLEKLSAIYENPNSEPVIDLIFGDYSINVNPEYMFNTPYNIMRLTAETTAPWLDDFINTGVSGNTDLDNIINTYGFYLDEYLITGVARLTLKTDMDAFNMNALEDDFLTVDNVLTAFPDVSLEDRLNYDGVPLTINNENVEASDITVVNNSYTFCIYAGDCLAGCLYSECWTIAVSEDCNTVVLGISENHLNTFTVYPNPSSDIIHLHGVTSEINTTLIYSVAGQLMYTSTSNSETIDISNLSAGIYFLELLTSEGDKQIQKFVKN